MTPVVERRLAVGQTFAEISVEELVDDAGLSRSTFYVYFEGKVELLEAVTDGVLIDLLDAGRAWWRMSPELSRAEVTAAMRRVVDTYAASHLLMQARVELQAYDAAARDRFRVVMGEVNAGIAAHITAGQASGHIHPGIEPRAAGAWIGCMVERGLAMLAGARNGVERDRYGAALGDIVWHALYDGAPARTTG